MKQKITEESVWGLADQLVGEGKEPSTPLIREKNGNHGNPTDISKHLKTWREERTQRGVASIPEMPLDKMKAGMSAIWLEMVTQARAEHDEERLAFSEREAELQTELEQCGEIVTKQDEQLEAVHTAHRELLALKEELTKDKQALQLDLAKQTERADQQERRLAEKGREFDNQTVELNKLRDDMEALKREKAQAEADKVELSQQLQATKAELSTATTEGRKCREQGKALQADLDQARMERDKAQASADRREKELIQTGTRLQGVEENLTASRGDLSMVRKELKQSAEQLRVVNKELVLKAEQAATATTEAAALRDQLAESSQRESVLQARLVSLAEGDKKTEN